ncbi:MAG: HIT domain-containing protein [Candidatus Kapabacteria bacterium]|nr:HIT domain-containing protein [Candidatus Kapabacteria bacterium]
MDQLWAPWRGEYVTKPGGQGAECFLCAASSVTEADPDLGLVHVARHSMIMLNRYPYSAGHLLIAPRSHEGAVEELSDDLYSCLMSSVRMAIRAVRNVYQPHGMNVGMNLGSAAGAGVPDHCHVHVVPRWHGDTNFMPVIGDVKVLAEAMSATWQKVADEIRRLESGR